jgi:hypothetical protein
MPIIKTQFREVSAIRNEIEAKRVKLDARKTNISVVDVKEISQKTGEKQGLIFIYEFTIEYPISEPKNLELGNVKIVGEIFYVDDAKVVENIIKEWKKDKKLSKEVITDILNVGMEEATIEAVYQTKKVGLPSPIPLPRLKSPKKGSVSAG